MTSSTETRRDGLGDDVEGDVVEVAHADGDLAAVERAAGGLPRPVEPLPQAGDPVHGDHVERHVRLALAQRRTPAARPGRAATARRGSTHVHMFL